MMRRDELVHARHVRVDVGVRPFRQRVPGRTSRAPGAERAKKTIGADRRGAEDFRQPPKTHAALEFHLPQAILRVRVAETVKRITFRRREDVRDGIFVAHDVHGRGNTRDSDRALQHRQ
jgi:hypothetical protein